MDDGVRVLRDGAVAVVGGRIAAVGTFGEVSRNYKAKKTIGGAGKAVMPGLINTHTHAAMVFMRGMADDLPLKDWLEGHIWPAENRWLSPRFIKDAVSLACLEMLKAGITTYSDMYFYEDVSAKTARQFGIRAVLGAGIVDFPTKTGSGRDDYLKKAEEFIKDCTGDELIVPAVAPHSAYACSPETLRMSSELAGKYNVLFHTHLAETKWERDEVKGKYGHTPVEILEAAGALEGRLVAAHCVWLTNREIELFAKKGVSVSHCVESNLKLASGIAPVPEMLKAGVRVTLGTDGAASNNDLNILSEMSTAAKLHKAVSGDPTALDAKTVLLMATRRAAEALGLGDVTGSLTEGKSADLIVIDLMKPHLCPVYNVESHIVYSARPSDVETVMVRGREVVKDGELLTADEDEILDKAVKWGERLRKG